MLSRVLGQIATQIAKARGCKVVAIDINDATLEVCKKQGADAVFNSRSDKDYVSKLKELTNGGAKAACVFSNAQAVGLTRARTMSRKMLTTFRLMLECRQFSASAVS